MRRRTKLNQKFHFGDLVKVADDLGPNMAHFHKGCRATVIASYEEQFGGVRGSEPIYTLHIEGHGECSWYHESQLTLIEANRKDLLETWEDQLEARERDLSDLAWIGRNWPIVKRQATAASILAIFRCLGFHSAFERNGEYICLYAEWEEGLPFIDFVIKQPTIEALRESQAEGASVIIVDSAERLWKATHLVKDQL